ncbi:MAG: hypothetical protein DMG52_34935 [Acidobacteria bacterium]|nr:MAG: hypothetical protein DMG52_34935 [Acidobacteriota bacterium]
MSKNTIGHQFAVNQVTVEDWLKEWIAKINNDVVDLLAERWGFYETSGLGRLRELLAHEQ